MRRGGVCAALALVAPLTATAQPARPTSVELAYGRESLSNDSPDWQETSVELGHRPGGREYWGAALRRTRRFALEDTSVWATWTRPVNDRLTFSAEASAAPGADFLPRYALAGVLQYEFAPGWLVHGGLKTVRYSTTRVAEGLLRLEQYVGDWSWSAAWKPVHSLGRRVHAFELRASWHYGERASVGLIAAAGREATSVGPQEVVLADVRSIALIGRHPIDARWALTYALGRTRQGSFYTRTGARLGVQYAF